MPEPHGGAFDHISTYTHDFVPHAIVAGMAVPANLHGMNGHEPSLCSAPVHNTADVHDVSTQQLDDGNKAAEVAVDSPSREVASAQHAQAGHLAEHAASCAASRTRTPIRHKLEGPSTYIAAMRGSAQSECGDGSALQCKVPWTEMRPNPYLAPAAAGDIV